MYYIYVIQNKLDLKVYVGQTVNPKKRWCDHKWLSKNKPEQYIHRAMVKYGIGNFIFQVIDQTDDGYKIDELETGWINWFKSKSKEYGYNISPSGSSAWNRGLPMEQQPMYGKHHSEESKQKISKSNLGKVIPHTKEWRLKMSNILKGHFTSEETKLKISYKHKGKIVSDETKLKMSMVKMGKPMPKETKDKLSVSHKSEDSSKAKLTWEDVNQIRYKFLKENISIKDLTKEYDVSRWTIYNILKEKTWKIRS